MSFHYSDVLTRIEKDKIVSCGAPACINWVDKNSNTIALVQ